MKLPDRKTDDVNYEKEKDECTFKPNIIPYPKREVKSKLEHINFPLVTVTPKKKLQGRIKKIVKVQNFKEEKVKKNKDFQEFMNNELKELEKSEDMFNVKIAEEKKENKSGSNSSDSETPILFLDVNFGNGEITRIVMYENDKPEELAEAFCKENGLDLAKKDRLVEIIYQQLETVLEKIDEESDENRH